MEPKLEVADEKMLDDEAEGDEGRGLEAFVDGLEDGMSDDDIPEPAPVNMEIASSGKVTARQEDGTRIQTPQPGTPVPGAARPDSSGDSPSVPASSRSLRTAGRPSYAAALASTPQDWHIEFSIDGKVIPNHTTIYRAVHHNREHPSDPTTRTVWSGVHTIKFKKVKGPPPSSSLATLAEKRKVDDKQLPASLDGHPITSSILGLLKLLHDLNAGLEDVCESIGRTGLRLYAEPLASFINTKLTAKMNRQLEEPLIVASNCLPDWAEDLARAFPFLFPFETRHLFLQSTSFGYSRSMIRWQSNQADNDDRRDRRRDDRPLLGRPQRQKVRISRHRILESAMKVMDMYGASPSVLEVEYFDEVGTGLGPTLEFYSSISKEFCKKKLKMWRENDSTKGDYAFGKSGLFPAPMSEADSKTENGKKLLQFFRVLGKFVARSMLDSRIIDVSFSPTFFKVGSPNAHPLSIALLRTIDQDLASSLALLQQYSNSKASIERDTSLSSTQKNAAIEKLTVTGATIEDLSLDFTLPGYPNVDLIKEGSKIDVTADNVDDYIARVLQMSLGEGVQRQIEAFQTGFSQVFSFDSLQAFTPDELVMLFGRVDEDWTIETLMDSVKADHGFNMDSKSVKNLLQVMSELTKEQRRDFLQFITGSPKLPIGGFKSLTPMFTVVCKPSEPPYTSDDYLPSVMTCVNYLKLPDYSDQEILKERLNVAIREGQGAFHLS
jgi:E3 ubiquitin-protein ligase TRIP12